MNHLEHISDIPGAQLKVSDHQYYDRSTSGNNSESWNGWFWNSSQDLAFLGWSLWLTQLLLCLCAPVNLELTEALPTSYFLAQNFFFFLTDFQNSLFLEVSSSWLFLVLGSESEVAQSCPTLCDPMDCSPPGSSVHGILQARILEWGAISGAYTQSRAVRTWSNATYCLGSNTVPTLVFVVVQSPSRILLFATPWTAACQASLPLTVSWSLPKFMFIASVMPSSPLILWHPLLPLP